MLLSVLLLAPALSAQSSSSLDMIPVEFEFRHQLETGKHFQPWVKRIKQGDPWAFAELTIECDRISMHLNGIGFDMTGIAIKGLEKLRSEDPGRASYYLAELTWMAGDPGKRDAPYIALLEESSKHGYAWADLKLYRECRQGGAYAKLKVPATGDQERHRVKRLELEAQCKQKAFERLLPLAQQGDVEARMRVYELHESRFDQLLTKSHAMELLEDSARRGSVRALARVEDIKKDTSDPQHSATMTEGSAEFQALVKVAEQYDPGAIQVLVDFYVGKKDWAKAKQWATKGKEALGGTNRWLEQAWDDVNPPEEEKGKREMK